MGRMVPLEVFTNPLRRALDSQRKAQGYVEGGSVHLLSIGYGPSVRRLLDPDEQLLFPLSPDQPDQKVEVEGRVDPNTTAVNPVTCSNPRP